MSPVEQSEGWSEHRPNWNSAVPITTFLRKLAKANDCWFEKRGFYRLFDDDFTNIEKD
jgi:hypothetical protein